MCFRFEIVSGPTCMQNISSAERFDTSMILKVCPYQYVMKILQHVKLCWGQSNVNWILTRNATGCNKNTFTGRYLQRDTPIYSFLYFFPNILTSFDNVMNEKDASKPVLYLFHTCIFPPSNYDCILLYLPYFFSSAIHVLIYI